MGHGSHDEKITQPERSIVFSLRQASRIAWISAWAVMSVVCQTTLCVQLTTSPARAMQEPNGVWPCWTPSRAFAIARRMRSPSVTGQMYHFGTSRVALEERGARSRRRWDVQCAARRLLRLHVEDRVLRPILEIEVPPLKLVDREAFGLHSAAQQFAMPAGERRAAGIIRIGTLGHLIVQSHHLGWLAGFQVVQRQVDGAPAVVARALAGVGDEDALVGWCTVPKHFRDVPGPVGVVNQQAVTHGVQLLMRAHQSFGGGALHESTRVRIEDSPHEIVGSSVANVELDGRVERRQLHKIGLAK